MTTAPQGDTEPGLQVYLLISTESPASELPSFAKLLELLTNHPLARTMQTNGNSGCYPGGMADSFLAYENELDLRDLDPKTRLRYRQVTRSYQRWLDGRDITPLTAREFLADLHKRGYRTANISLYYTCLRPFRNFLDLKQQLKIRKPQVLPPA